uniref:Uncharacterized protein n=1 Tax=Anguilla anguilla TaxID=7936 RepID=A0A0E9WZH8_ANGAN
MCVSSMGMFLSAVKGNCRMKSLTNFDNKTSLIQSVSVKKIFQTADPPCPVYVPCPPTPHKQGEAELPEMTKAFDRTATSAVSFEVRQVYAHPFKGISSNPPPKVYFPALDLMFSFYKRGGINLQCAFKLYHVCLGMLMQYKNCQSCHFLVCFQPSFP